MKKNGSLKNKKANKICIVMVIVIIISCVTIPTFASTINKEKLYKNSEVEYQNQSVGSGSYLSDNTDKISSKYNELKNKNIAIIGDSISTLEGYIPENYKYFYSKGDVDSVSETWWGRLVENTGVNIVSNCSWSGSTVTGDSSSKVNAYAASSTKRVMDLSKNGIKPDIIICYIGINDYRRNVEVGQWTAEDEIEYNTGKSATFSEAYAIMVSKIKKAYPKAKVYLTTLMECDDKNNKATYSLEGYNAAIKEVADKFDTEVVDLNSFVVDKDDYSAYTLDRLHPNAAGHEQMSKRFEEALLK